MKNEIKELQDERLIDALEAIGDTPLKEEKLYKKLIENDLKALIEIPDMILGSEVADSVNEDELLFFIGEVRKKVLGLKDKEGYFKSTKATENMSLPSRREKVEITELATKRFEAKSDSEIKEIDIKLDELIWNVSGLNKEDLTEWEKLLVSEQIQEASFDATFTAMGKPLKN